MATSTLTLTEEQAGLIERALLLLDAADVVDKLIKRVRSARERIRNAGQNSSRNSGADRRSAARTRAAVPASPAASVPRSATGHRSAGATAGLRVGGVPEKHERVASRRKVDRDMRQILRDLARGVAAAVVFVVALFILTGCPKSAPAHDDGDRCSTAGQAATSQEGQTLVCTREPAGLFWRVRS